MNEHAPRWPLKVTRYSCGMRGCGAAVALTIIDPLPAGWQTIERGAVPRNWATGGVGRIADGKCAYACPSCARELAAAQGGPR